MVMIRIIDIQTRENCTGCGACKAICPKDAISFCDDEAGFLYPQMEKGKCIQCGMCESVCPVLNKQKTQTVKEAFAVQSINRALLRESTSGGVFGIIATSIFSLGGVVYGCVWDEAYNAVFSRAENVAQLSPMHGSKYVWSWAGNVLKNVKEDLDKGTLVLFSGFPCQVAGLNAYLNKAYENLITLDFLCSGAPSPMALKSYLRTISTDENLSDLNLKFRDKDPLGVGVHITYKGQKKQIIQKGQHITNPYYYSFYCHLTNRTCCYSCQYSSEERVSDLTMGDYWGVSAFHNDMNAFNGISALTVNTNKGSNILRLIEKDAIIAPSKLENIAKNNNLLIGKLKSYNRPREREAFLERVRTRGWKSAERRYLINSSRVKRLLKALMIEKDIKWCKRLFKL